MNKSIATINSPEFINLQPLDINPLMSKCEIKVLYTGENRNGSFISKEVATEMAKTLRGAPIVGYYKEEKEDYADHGRQMVFDDEGIHFNCLTTPYGFVSPDAQVWFKEFEDTDDFGNTVVREYLMTTGYLWTGQFEECARVLESGNNQSMEIDEDSMDGHWSTNNKTGMDFFIINDATFSKLCILGEDVEPCFEGARITAPDISTSFTKVVDDNFKQTLFSMMQDLKNALEGGQNMDNENTEVVVEDVVETPAVVVEEEVVTTEIEETVVEENDKIEQSISEENQESIEDTLPNQEDFAKKEDEEDKEDDASEEDSEDNKEENDDNKDEDDEEEKKKYSLLEEEHEALKAKYSELEVEYNKLVEFKTAIDNEKKDALINSFYMLTDEDKKDVIENKVNYSLEEIEAKLSVICFRKKVSFDLVDEGEKTQTEEIITTFNLLHAEEDQAPAWIKAARAMKEQELNK